MMKIFGMNRCGIRRLTDFLPACLVSKGDGKTFFGGSDDPAGKPDRFLGIRQGKREPNFFTDGRGSGGFDEHTDVTDVADKILAQEIIDFIIDQNRTIAPAIGATTLVLPTIQLAQQLKLLGDGHVTDQVDQARRYSGFVGNGVSAFRHSVKSFTVVTQPGRKKVRATLEPALKRQELSIESSS
jgi:hypothetical protein